MEKDIEKEYGQLSKKYKLPKFEDIDKYFEISALETQRFLIQNVLRKIAEKLEMYADAIIMLVHPDGSSLITMHEVKFFSDDEKNEMYITFKSLMKTIRSIAELSLGNDEKEQANFLNEFFNEWPEIKKKLIAYTRKMKECWEKESSIEEDLGYLG